jgi:phosphotriesterase-related protein
MKQIMTILGPIAPEELGPTSMHEHILMDGRTAWWQDEPFTSGEYSISSDEPVSLESIGLLRRKWFLSRDNMILDDEELMTAEVADFKAAGGGAMVEVSSIGLRLDLPGIRRISQKTGVHVVATTGLYQDNSWPEHIQSLTVDQLADLMVREIEEGIDDTGIRAGHIGEFGIQDVSERDVRALRAAARASIRTGLSVTAHQATGKPHGHKAIDILTQEGMDPERIIICHVDEFLFEREVRVLLKDPDRWRLNLDFARSLLDRGVTISFDLFGHMFDVEINGVALAMVADWQRCVALVRLIDAGYASQIVLGTDTFIKTLLSRYGGEGYAYLINHVVPTLRSLGVCDYDIKQMTVHNPARLLGR